MDNMLRAACVSLLAFAGSLAADDVVFRTDVSLVRVDAQVVDSNNRAVTGLTARDFVLKEDGRQQEIRNFASEDMPVDVLLLLDVSGSMLAGEADSPKLRYACLLAATLAHLAARQRDAVGLTLFADRVIEHHNARATSDHRLALFAALSRQREHPRADSIRVLHEAAELMPVLCDETMRLADGLSAGELARAKAQMKAGLLMSLESTGARCEQMATHMLVHGTPFDPADIVRRVEAVDGDAIGRLVARWGGAAPTLAALEARLRPTVATAERAPLGSRAW